MGTVNHMSLGDIYDEKDVSETYKKTILYSKE